MSLLLIKLLEKEGNYTLTNMYKALKYIHMYVRWRNCTPNIFTMRWEASSFLNIWQYVSSTQHDKKEMSNFENLFKTLLLVQNNIHMYVCISRSEQGQITMTKAKTTCSISQTF